MGNAVRFLTLVTAHSNAEFAFWLVRLPICHLALGRTVTSCSASSTCFSRCLAKNFERYDGEDFHDMHSSFETESFAFFIQPVSAQHKRKHATTLSVLEESSPCKLSVLEEFFLQAHGRRLEDRDLVRYFSNQMREVLVSQSNGFGY